jgi:hypothetical protein
VGALLGDLATTSRVAAVRLPAVSQFLPGLVRFGPLVATVVHDGKVNVLGDAYPRPACDYGTPRSPPTVGGSPRRGSTATASRAGPD